MGIYILLQRYLDKQNDQRFLHLWEKYVVGNLPRFFFVLSMIFIGVMLLIGYLIGLALGFFLTLFLTIVIAAYLGYDMVVETIRFFAINNQRYLLLKMGKNDSGINYDNVVG